MKICGPNKNLPLVDKYYLVLRSYQELMPRKFIFLVLPHVHLLDLAGPDQVISEAIDMGADFTIEYCGTETEIHTSAGLGLCQLVHFSEIRYSEGDYIIIPGMRAGYVSSDAFTKNTVLFDWLRKAHSRKAILVSICVGSFVLAEAGLLNHTECTTHFSLTKKLQKKYRRSLVKENVLFCFDHNIYTSAGIASGIDLMLHIIERETDSHFAHRVAQELVVYKRRNGITEQHSIYFQYREHIHRGIHTVQDFIIENISRKHTMAHLAEKANMSERNFSRLFKKETGITVNSFITKARIEHAKTLCINPDLSRKQIANMVGLESERQLSRLLINNG